MEIEIDCVSTSIHVQACDVHLDCRNFNACEPAREGVSHVPSHNILGIIRVQSSRRS